MRTLLLVKHAPPRIDPLAPGPAWPLSEEGRALCPPLAEALRVYAPGFVVASREAKAAETGLLVAKTLKVPFGTAPGLHEHDRRAVPFYPDRREFVARMRDMLARPAERLLGSESAAEAHARFQRAVAGVLERNPEGNPVVVTHGTVIALFVARAAGTDPFPLWAGLKLPSFVALSWPDLALTGSWNVMGRSET
jgi:broad specificity phosphatase PhoE